MGRSPPYHKDRSEVMVLPNAAGRVLLGIVDYQEAKRIQSRLEDRGIMVWLHSPQASDCGPDSCKPTSCQPSVELHALEVDVPKIREFFAEEKAKLFEGLEFNPELMSEVFDPDKETARCPACGTEFSTRLAECPDCGLAFGPTSGSLGDPVEE